MITRPRLVIATSLRTGGRPRSSIFGILVVIVRSTMPTRACCTKALTRKRPTPARRVDGEVAFLGSLEFLRLLVVHQRACQFLRMLRRQALVRHRRHLAIELE